MSKKQRFTWLISPKSFVDLLGAEYEMMRRSSSNVLLKFYVSAVALILILIISILSIFYAMKLLFHMVHIEVLMSCFISLLFVFIYVFLLNTFSKESTNTNENHRYFKQKHISLANIVRISFIVLMAFLISKPVEVYLFQRKLENNVLDYKESILRSYSVAVNRLDSAEEQKLINSIRIHEQQLINYSSQNLLDVLVRENDAWSRIKTKRTGILGQAALKVNQSDFFIYRVQMVSRQPLAWVVCVLIISLFLLPFILISTIPADDEYYKTKKANELDMIIEEYSAFLRKYALLFQRRYDLKIEHFTVFEDPPINKRRKAKPAFKSQTDFLSKYS